MSAKKHYWTKKKLFTVRFKGRKPRALLWRKAVYREWFEYAKLAQRNGRNIPPEFGDLNSFNGFEEWWRHPDYGFELFCEPYMDEGVKLLSEPPEIIEPDNILVSVNLNADREKLEQLFSKILKQKNISEEYSSMARFQPSRDMKYFKIDFRNNKNNKLRLAREAWVLSQSMTEERVAHELRLFPYRNTQTEGDQRLSGIRTVSRYKNFVRRAFKSIEQGSFP